MASLLDQKIVLGVSGGIAAYKSAELVRLLKKAGAQVRVVMTANASQFVTPLTLQALSGEAVRSALFDAQAEAAMSHIELARWADLILIAPCSADLMAKLANGLADDLLSTLCLASEAPIWLAPAMNRVMWSKMVTQVNVQRLRSFGFHLLGPGSGEQACGEVGVGRMLEPEALLAEVVEFFSPFEPFLAGVKVLITAGPTHEAIDPVRYISNRSSGKMGFALAQVATEAGAEVSLVSGPVALATPAGVLRTEVESALQMHTAVMQQVFEQDIFIACAAVADYCLEQPSAEKIKKSSEELVLQLQRNADILAEVSALDEDERPFCVGFAAETQNLEQYALDKMQRKQLDLIAANLVGVERAAMYSPWCSSARGTRKPSRLRRANSARRAASRSAAAGPGPPLE
ncbi:MAG: bifunctional phosphopantothenoylcysteine decarboxylase/phosphopantothenate--cysteine ligase CoaBC, partial [Gammaproteobacteria bacterium]|nr:bifunctional phosphopantothenoylcysteine decarboxylase/phosphopantothenate--cysteine ligase CoaBC [Gammaproteobacteria bacterium]